MPNSEAIYSDGPLFVNLGILPQTDRPDCPRRALLPGERWRGAITNRRVLTGSKDRWYLATKLDSEMALDNDRDKTLAGRQHLDRPRLSPPRGIPLRHPEILMDEGVCVNVGDFWVNVHLGGDL
jgi:hypothetical protein